MGCLIPIVLIVFLINPAMGLMTAIILLIVLALASLKK
ncbi:hypothetical protein [Lactococcus phage P1048]|uniref:Uncharacterized protein n=1 Tax=Lactococcus phage P1048 TaxID=2662295 RepID=A0A649V2B2_9CAUD|nr:hypothetical protein H1Z36_gp161 [Lactococcus phage P1048]QGJ84967.1 hypothetical protein [Lactococcus phage P1048]